MTQQKDTKYIIKDRGEGGALPDNPEEMRNAVETRRRINEKALVGKVALKHAAPSVFAGDTLVLKGLGPLFSGQYVIEKHTIELSVGSGLRSKFDVSRNAVGDTRGGGDSPSPSDEATEGSTTTDEDTEMHQFSIDEIIQSIVDPSWLFEVPSDEE